MSSRSDPMVAGASLRGAAALVAIALVPYATVLLRFQTALWVQGIAIAAVVACLLLAGARDVPRAVLEAPRAVVWGLGLYASAALWGAVVGSASGNPTRYVATQLASMLLLPAAFLAFGAGRRITPGELAGGLGAAAGVALAVHLAAFLGVGALQPPPGEPIRLCLRNDVSFTGIAVLGFLVASAWRRSGPGWERDAATVCLGIVAVGGMSRGAWIAAGVGLVAWALLSGLVDARLALRMALVASAALGALAATSWWIGRSSILPIDVALPAAEGPPAQAPPAGGRARLLADAATGDLVVPLARGLPVRARAVEVDLWLLGPEGTSALLIVDGRRPEDTTRARLRVQGRDAWVRFRAVQFLPAGARAVDIGFRTTGGRWLVADARLHLLQTPVAAWVRALHLRLRATITAFTSPETDPTVQYRWREWRAVRAAWAAAAPWRLIVGQGLGATFPFRNASYDAEGRRVTVPTASYIHDFFVFLGFKLGIAGFAALAGLGLLAGWTAVRALRERGSGQAGWLVPAAVAAWLGYLVWGLTSPEILDFRVAPILGALLVATALHTEAPRSESAAGAIPERASSPPDDPGGLERPGMG